MAIVLSQTVKGNGGAYSNSYTAPINSVTSGSLLVLGITLSNTASSFGVTDNKGNTWVQAETDTSGERTSYLYYAKNVASGNTVLSLTFSSYPDSAYILREYTGVDITNPLDVSASDNSGVNFVNSHSSGATSVTTYADQVVIGYVGSGGTESPVFVAGAGYGNLTSQQGHDAFTYSAMEDKIVAATAAQTATFTSTGFVRSQTLVATFKDTGGAVAPSAPTNLSATAGNTNVSLNWTAPTGATSYTVKRALSAGGVYSNVGSPTTNSFLNTGLVNGTTYYYKVSATNFVGTSSDSSVVSAIPSETPTYQWHPYGTQPNLSVSQLRTAIRQFYDNWMGYTMKTTGIPTAITGAKRISVPDQIIYPQVKGTGGTVSEGQAYGMLLKAWFSNPDLGSGIYDVNAKADFDALWMFYDHFKDANGLMHWNIENDGTQTANADGHFGATDGDLDAAMGLVIMSRIHGNGGAVNYGAEATTLINAIRDFEVVPVDYATVAWRNLITPGDGWGFAHDIYMSDYFRAAWIREFREHTGDTRWDTILTVNYTQALQYWHDNYLGGVVPDRQERDNTVYPGYDPQKATYNSVRLGFGVATDYLWNGSGTVPAICANMMNKMANRSKALYTTGANVKAPNYSLDGVSEVGYSNASGYGMVGPAALISSSNQIFATEIFNALSASTDQTTSYFSGGVGLMALAVMSGIAQPLRGFGGGGSPALTFNAQLLISD